MTLYYEVVPNNVKQGHYYPRVVKENRISFERLVAEISYQTVLTEVDIRAVVHALVRRVRFHLAQGDLPEIEGLVSFKISLREDLASLDGRVSKDVEISLKAHPARDLQKWVAEMLEYKQAYTRPRRPNPTILCDGHSGLNNVYTPGNIASLHGDELKFDASQPDEGVFFISVADGTTARASGYLNSGSRQIYFSIPPGISGDQRVEVRTSYGGDYVFSGALDKVVTEVVY